MIRTMGKWKYRSITLPERDTFIGCLILASFRVAGWHVIVDLGEKIYLGREMEVP